MLEIVKNDKEFAKTSYESINERIPQFGEIVNTIGPAIGDGFQFDDVVAFGKVVGPFMELAKTIHNFTGEEKKAFVVDAVWLTYRAIDTYPDGKHNNINVPVLWGGAEKKFEKRVIRFCTSWAVNALYDRMKKDGDV